MPQSRLPFIDNGISFHRVFTNDIPCFFTGWRIFCFFPWIRSRSRWNRSWFFCRRIGNVINTPSGCWSDGRFGCFRYRCYLFRWSICCLFVVIYTCGILIRINCNANNNKDYYNNGNDDLPIPSSQIPSPSINIDSVGLQILLVLLKENKPFKGIFSVI